MLSLDSILHNRYRIDRLHELRAVETIYLGWDTLSDLTVTISEMKAQPNLAHDDLETLKKNFTQQAQNLCALKHNHLIAPSDSFIIDATTDIAVHDSENGMIVSHSYVISPAIAYDSLMQRITDQGALPEDSVILWAGQVLDALTYCHNQHVLHGDIRPHNIFITPEGNAILAHFEVPSLWHTADPRKWTAKRVLGTPDYAPPERWVMRVGQIDQRSDIYSLGATLLHALTGKLPISAEERIANPYSHQNIQISNPKIRGHLKNIIARSMAVPKDKRYTSAAAMVTDLRVSDSNRILNIKPMNPLLFLPTSAQKITWQKIVGLIISSIVLVFAGLLGMWLHTIAPPVKTWFSQPPTSTIITTAVPTPLSVLTETLLATPTTQPTTLIPTVTPTQRIEVLVSEQTAIISDTFDSNSYQWPISDSQDEWGSIVREVTGGAYVWQVGADQDVGRWCLPDSDSYATDFRLSVDIRRLNGPLNIAYGLIIRHNEGIYYVFNVRDDGFFRFSLWQGAEWITIIDWTETLSIHSGDFNHLEVSTKGPVFEFYINDTFVAEAEDQEITAGDNGLSAIVLTNAEITTLEFDNFILFSENPR
jgi:serine/threonine protein kinase